MNPATLHSIYPLLGFLKVKIPPAAEIQNRKRRMHRDVSKKLRN